MTAYNKPQKTIFEHTEKGKKERYVVEFVIKKQPRHKRKQENAKCIECGKAFSKPFSSADINSEIISIASVATDEEVEVGSGLWHGIRMDFWSKYRITPVGSSEYCEECRHLKNEDLEVYTPRHQL